MRTTRLGLSIRAQNIRVLLTVAMLSFVVTACGTQSQSGSDTEASNEVGSEPVRIANATWIGYTGLWVAEDEGFFEDEGVNVESTAIEDPAQINSALKAGRLDGTGDTVDSLARLRSQGVPTNAVLAVDKSKGADGIIAVDGVQSVADLEGKTVAVQSVSPSEWMLAQVLEKNGMSLDDIKTRDMTADQAGTAFAAGKVDVAVTWEPWLTKASQGDNGGILVSTEKYPEIIVDSFGFTDTFIEERPEAAQAFLRAYDRGVKLIEENPERVYEIAADHTGGTPEDAKTQLEGVELMDVADSQEFMGTPEEPGPMFDLARNSGQFWSEKGLLDEPPAPEEYLDASLMADYGN